MWEVNKIGVINTSDLFIHQEIRYIPVKPREREKKRMSKINKSKGYENVFYLFYTIKFQNGKVFRNILKISILF